MDYPQFPDAVSRLHTFLRDCGVPDDVHWVGFPDATWVRGRFYLCPPSRHRATASAQRKYEQAIVRRLGVKFGTLCRAGATVYCYVYRPSSALEGQYHRMPDGLKISVPTQLREATVVHDPAEWARLQNEEHDLRIKRSFFG